MYTGVFQATKELDELPNVITLASHRRDLALLIIGWLHELAFWNTNSPLDFLNLIKDHRYYFSVEFELESTVDALYNTEK
ncbi:MAG: hypothetical protein V2I33_21455 [Kangiellaceae bacterium]|nr:hypothetical protein [Kangiellaceae bacterium]